MPSGIYKRNKKGNIKSCLICGEKFYIFPYRKTDNFAGKARRLII